MTLFPTEDIHLYYVSPISKRNSLNKRSISVRGKLVEKYRNKLQKQKRLFDSDTTDITSNTDQESETSIDGRYFYVFLFIYRYKT